MKLKVFIATAILAIVHIVVFVGFIYLHFLNDALSRFLLGVGWFFIVVGLVNWALDTIKEYEKEIH